MPTLLQAEAGTCYEAPLNRWVGDAKQLTNKQTWSIWTERLSKQFGWTIVEYTSKLYETSIKTLNNKSASQGRTEGQTLRGL